MIKHKSLLVKLGIALVVTVGFVAAVSIFAEEPTTVTGTLEAVHGDDFAKNTETDHYSLKTANGKRVPLDVSARPSAKPGAKVNATGQKRQGKLKIAADQENQAIQTVQPAPYAGSTEVNKLAVILFHFADQPAANFTPDQIRPFIFTDHPGVNDWYKEVSHNQVSFVGKQRTDGDVFGWLQIPATTEDCQQGIKFYDWIPQIRGVAAQQGISLDGYDRFILLGPIPNCGPAYTVYSDGGYFAFENVARGNSPANDVNSPEILVHELGHSFGLGHSNFLFCADPNQQPISGIGGNCEDQDGNDFDSFMSFNTYHAPYANGPEQEYLGWLYPDSIQEVATSGTFSVAPIENASGTRLLKVLRKPAQGQPTDPNYELPEYFYLEFRQPIGYDSFLAGPQPDWHAHLGVGIRLRTYLQWGYTTQLLGMYPSPPRTPYNRYGALEPGKSFEDPVSHIKITTQSAGLSGATVQVAFPGQVVPTPSPEPSVQPTPTSPLITPSPVSATATPTSGAAGQPQAPTAGSAQSSKAQSGSKKITPANIVQRLVSAKLPSTGIPLFVPVLTVILIGYLLLRYQRKHRAQ